MRKPPRNHLEIEHHVPGRTRVRLHKKHLDSHHAKLVHNKLAQVPGVASVQINERTGSIVLEHDEHPGMFSSISSVVGGLGTELLELVVEVEEIEMAEVLFLGGMILTGVFDLLAKHVKPSRKPGLIHHTDGRTRFKLHDHNSNPDHMDNLSDRLGEVDGVRRVEQNHKTGSVIVHHDSQHATLRSIGDVISNHSGELFESIIKMESPVSIGAHIFTDILSSKHSDKQSEENSLNRLLPTAAVYLLLSKYFHSK